MPTGRTGLTPRRTRRPTTTSRRPPWRLAALEDRLTPANALLPDLQVLSSYLSGWTVNPTAGTGREVRYATALANGGQGAFELRGTTTILTEPDGTQRQVVNQRVYQDDTTFVDRLAGHFTYHPGHGHVHFDDMARGQLRIRTPGNGLGDVVAVGPKTSFCLIDISRFNPSLPGSPAAAGYPTCGAERQGISVGWTDVYGSSLEGQSIDVTGLPNGDYWLEVVADPLNRIAETNEENNLTRVPITLATLPAVGFRVQAATPTGASHDPVSAVELTFNRPVDAATLTADDFAITGPGGAVPVIGVTAVNTVTFRAEFATQSAVGTYTVTVGPDVLSAAGALLDQNNDGAGGEPADRYINVFTVTAPRVLGTTPAGAVPPPVGSVRIVYNKPVNAATFTLEDVASFTGPGGVDLRGQLTGVMPVTAGGASALFDITFPPQTALGLYTLVLEPTVLDLHGNPVDQNGDRISNAADRFTVTFGLAPPGTAGPDGYGYAGKATVVQDYGVAGRPGAVAVTFSSTDDAATAINLGAHTFTFHGQTYTGNDQLFVSTNGLISFGQAYTSYQNDDLTDTTLPVIAVLWDDLVRGTGTPQAAYRIDDADGDGAIDRLIVEWNQVKHLGSDSGAAAGMTFQAVLQLNTGPTPGRIVLNYPDLITGDSYAHGTSATVGLRGGGAVAPRLVVPRNGSNSLVGSDRAIQLAVPTVGSITRLGADPANAGGVEFLVTFTEAVTGVDVADFALTTTGTLPAARVDHIHTTADPRVYEVHVLTGPGDGTVRLDLADDDSILTTLGARLGGLGAGNGTFRSGEAYTVVQTPPRVQGVNVGDGTAQRSAVRLLQVVFDRPVTFQGNPADAFVVTGPNGPVAVSADLSLSPPEQTVVRLTFSGPGTEFGSLADGHYTLRVLGANVSAGGTALDGDGDGQAGGDSVTAFHRLFGDATGDRRVDNADFFLFRTAFGRSTGDPLFLAFLDANGDGRVDNADFFAFRNRFGTSI
jgi:hypothetical protein